MSKKSKFLVVQAELLLLTPQDCVRFALFCAEQVRDSWKDIPECVAAINMVERWLKGKAAEEECVNASSAAYDAAYAANAAAAYAAAYAAYDGKSHLIKAQRNYYLELLHFDDIAEKLLLGATI